MLLSRQQARRLDQKAMQELAIPGLVLMENAGRGMAELLLSFGVPGRVVCCCGKGNNGGDGLVIARHLAHAGASVWVVVFAEPARLPADAAANYAIIERLSSRATAGNQPGPPVTLATYPADVGDQRLAAELAGADWVVDALFGTGLRGPVPAPFERIIAAINASGGRVLAVDIPSGLDCDSGQPCGPTVRADHTATVAAAKKGFDQPAAASWLGQVHVIDLIAGKVLTGPPSGILQWLLEELAKESVAGGTDA
jgi:NAD(P)H-hydrate epimerase